MNNQAKNNSLLERYTQIFLEVSAQMQHHGYEWEELLKENFPKLDIVYGYFVEFDPNANQIKYLIESDINERNNTSFKPTFIPYFGNNHSKHPMLNRSLRINSATNFESILSSPKVYQHLPIQKKSNIKLSYISDNYLYNYISLKIRSTNDYYVVLFEEIVFFQFAYLYKSNTITSDYFLGREKLLINYLIKFALSVEKKNAKELSLHTFLDINIFDNWNTEKEIDIRSIVNKIVEINISNTTWFNDILNLTQEIVTNLLEEYKKNEEYAILSDVEILKHISRFDIESSFLVTNDEGKPILHDIFIFPLYTETDTVFKTKYILPNVELDIHSPILLVLFIKTLFEISGQKEYDETEESIKGFQLTKEIVKLFAGKIIQDDYLKSVLRKEISIPATTSAISQVFARNMSHNIGSHVSYRATNGQVKKRAKELYPYIKTNKEDFAAWLDYFSERLDKYEIYRNEYLADFDQSPKFVRFYQDLVLPFCENMLVMDNIAAGESLHYKTIHDNKLKIKCLINGREIKAAYPDLACMIVDKNCAEEINYPYNFPYLLQNKDFPSKCKEEDIETLMAKYSLESAIANKQIKWVDTEGVAEDVEICLHSEQAIYSILENLIRNSAKHKPKGSGDELIIYLDLRTTEKEDYYTLYLYDNSSKIEKRFLYSEDSNKAGIYQRINESLLEETGKPRKANWGFADMKINSFLLLNRVNAIEDTKLPKNFGLVVMDDAKQPFLIDDNSIKELTDGEQYRFGYKMHLSIARKILWVGAFEGDNQAQLEKQGLMIVNNLEAVKAIKSEGLVAFQFVVINTDFTEGVYLGIEEKLPGRIIVLKGNPTFESGHTTRIVNASSSIVPTDIMPEMLKWCWQEWLTVRNGAIDMYSYFEDDVIASQWQDIKLSKNLNSVIIDQLEAQKILQDDVVNIVYNRHGGAFNEGLIACNQDKYGDDELNFATKHSIIFFDKGSEDFSLLTYPPQQADDKELLMYQLMDAATTNVFIIDERISEYACNDLPHEFRTNGIGIGTEALQNSNWNMYAAGKLFVIQEIKNGDVSCNVGDMKEKLTLDIEEASMRLLSDIDNLSSIDNLRKDVLIVHRTYLDNAKIGMEPEEFLEKAKKQFGLVFITSGGGYPHNLTMSCKFIPFSTLESCINSRLSKNKLNSLIKSNIR